MKYLLLIALVAVVWWVWGKRRRSADSSAPRVAAPPENMVSCAHCGVHMPESDSVRDGDRRFCSEAHRDASRESSRRS